MAEKSTSQSRVWVGAIAALVVLLVIYFAWRSSRPVATVLTAQVMRGSIASTSSTNGQVQPTQDFQAHASAPGSVAKLYVTLGQEVRQGQQLVQMDASDAQERVATARATLAGNEQGLKNMQNGGSQDELLTAHNNVADTQAEIKQDQASLATLQRLQAQGAASANEVAAAQQKLTEAQTRLAQVQSRRTNRYNTGDLNAQRALVSQAQAALNAAESAYSGVDIRAPFAGTVYSLPVAQYNFVGAGTLLLAIANLHTLQVRAYFDEPEIGKLQVGQPVTITWDAKPGRIWHGHILQAPTTVTTYGTRNVGEALITVDDANGDLLPNTNVTAKVTTQQKSNVLVLPREALHTEGVNDFVYRVIDGHLVRTPVQVGISNLVSFEVLGGLKEGDPVALHTLNGLDLSDGMHIRVRP